MAAMAQRAFLAALIGGAGALASFMTRGKLTLDLGWGRSIHAVGPLCVRIAAPRELVFSELSAPYLEGAGERGPHRAEILERGEDGVVARHLTKVWFYTVETVEYVRFDPPRRVTFRHLRGPVPHATEEIVLREAGGATELEYRGEVGIDFWSLGRLAGRHWVIPVWEGQVRGSLQGIRVRCESPRMPTREIRHRSGD